jgi:CheY-like chemotaxis protein
MLAVILGVADLLAPQLAASGQKDGVDLLNKAIGAAERARNLTTKLLACSRRGRLQTAPVDVHHVIRETFDILARSIDRRIEIKLDLKANWYVMNGVAAQIESLFLNLGVNARDALPQGGRIAVRTSDEEILPDNPLVSCLGLSPGNYLRIEFSDTGVGMTRAVMAHVFEPFFTTKKPGEGTGLGLTMVYGTVKDHGGHIQIWSEPGQGTQFVLRLPATPHLNAEAMPAEMPGAFTPGRILVVDDEPLVRSVAETLLHNLGCEVLTAVDGVEAVALFEKHHATLSAVILDLVMPRMDGRATFEACHRIDPEVPILLSSGYCSSETVDYLLRAGARGMLSKPYRRDEMIHQLSQVMRRL